MLHAGSVDFYLAQCAFELKFPGMLKRTYSHGIIKKKFDQQTSYNSIFNHKSLNAWLNFSVPNLTVFVPAIISFTTLTYGSALHT